MSAFLPLLLGALAATPRSVRVDLLRTEADGDRVYVLATLPGGEPALFLVDTGADVSALAEPLVRRLGLAVEEEAGLVSGLSHQATVGLAALRGARLGDLPLPDVEVVVGLPGGLGPEGLPVAGLLGNNVWSRFVVELDYQRDQLTLHPPGHTVPRRGAPLRFDGHHATTPVVLRPADGAPPVSAVLAVDTGADEVVLFGPIDGPATGWTTGLELMPGVAGADDLPITAWLRTTRRLPLAGVALGGELVDRPLLVRQLERGVPDDLGLEGLVGHQALDGRRVWLDYQRGRIVVRSAGPPAAHDWHDAWTALLDADVARFGDAPERLLERARLAIGRGDLDLAWSWLESLLASSDRAASPGHDVARALSAAILRSRGDLDGAWHVLGPLPVGRLVDLGELPAAVGGLLLTDRIDTARDVVDAALTTRPDHPAVWQARSDLLLHLGDAEGAWAAMQEAVRLTRTPDAWPLRRARVALARGDRQAAQALLRDALASNPLDGKLFWFYAEIGEDAAATAADVAAAEARLHPTAASHDFLVGAWRTLGDDVRAHAHLEQGLHDDCEDRPALERQNCEAWYLALGGERLDEAVRLARASVAAAPLRTDFLDTLATAHLARGEWGEARRVAVEALRLAPADAYLRWQVDRVDRATAAAAEDDMVPHTLLPLLLAAPSGPLPSGGRVVKVYDGDTYTLESGDKIRLRLVNTPELKPAEPYGDEARELAARWLDGREVKLEVSPEGRDGYGRVLASVRTDEGPVALALLEAGLGHLFIIPPEGTDLTPYYAAQDRARAAGRGIWTLEGFKAGMHITSFHANGSGDDEADPTGEYFRICNVAAGPIDLSTWSVRTRGGRELRLPKVTVPSGWTVKVASGRGVDVTDPTRPLTVYLQTDGPVYDDEFDVLQLIAPNGQVVEERPSKSH